MKPGIKINLLILLLFFHLKGFTQQNSELIPGKLFRNISKTENQYSAGSFRLLSVSDSVYFDLSNSYQVTSVIDVPIYFRSLDSIHSLDFALQYNDQIAFFDTLIVQLSNLQYMYFYNPVDSTLRFTSSSLSTYPGDSAIIILRFQIFSGPFCSGDIYNIETWLNGDNCQNETINCVISGIDEMKSPAVMISPNPCRDRLNVHLNEDASALLFDLNGNQVLFPFPIHADEPCSLDISTLKNGVYLLKIENENSRVITRVVVNN